jgi:hypothetical protein
MREPRRSTLPGSLPLWLFACVCWTSAATAGCSLDDCSLGAFRCLGDSAQTCKLSDGSEFYNWQTYDCSAQGQTCRRGTAAAECVYANRPCTASSCVDGEAIHCGTSKFVTGTEVCEADATCDTAGVQVACVYADAPCPASGANAFCAADGVTLYRCDVYPGFAAATYRTVCSDPTPRCLEIQNTAHCVAP